MKKTSISSKLLNAIILKSKYKSAFDFAKNNNITESTIYNTLNGKTTLNLTTIDNLLKDNDLDFSFIIKKKKKQ